MVIKGIIFNVGSETIKYSFFENNYILEKNIIYIRPNKKNILKIIKEAKYKLGKIDIVAHRIVHGYDNKSGFINNKLIKEIEHAKNLALLHNPFQLKVIKILKKEFPKLKQFVAFDTDIFKDLPPISKTYALPLSIVKKFKIYKFGFHGLNIEYIINILKKGFGNKVNAIVFHLGAGCSVTAIKNGKVIETSMGFTPLDGCIMVNRPGSIDPGIVLFLCEKLGIKKTQEILHKSGLIALTGIKDMKKIIRLKNKKRKYNFAFELFCYKASQIAASYLINFSKGINDIQAFVFTGGIGESSWQVRERIMKFLGLSLNKEKNKKNKKYIRNKKPYILVIKSNEEKIILDKLLGLIKWKEKLK